MFLLLLGSLVTLSTSDFLSSCPSLCTCKWSSGKQTADCSSNGLTTVPQDIHHDVQVLIMDGNYLKDLPKDIFSSLGLNHLQKISFKDSNIQTIHESAFSDLKILKEINLAGNNLSSLPPQAFQGNDGLRTLLLGGNNIARLQAHQFPPLRNLRKIDLSANKLVEIDQVAFQNLAQGDVEEINLADNMLRSMSDKTFLALDSLKHLHLGGNPWLCDCQLKSFRDLVVHRALSTGAPTICAEPVRLADKPWEKVESQEFACKPTVVVAEPVVQAIKGANATLQCRILGNPPPAVKWVLNGRVIKNRSAPLTAKPGQIYLIQSVATMEGGIELNHSLTITGVTSSDLGTYSCVAINNGGVSEKEVTLTFDSPGSVGGILPLDEKQLTIVIGVASGVLLILIVLLIILCCCCRRQRKDKNGHSPQGSVLGYSDPANEKLLPGPRNGTINHRVNPVQKPMRTGQYGGGEEQEMLTYGPESYVPGDRYDELGEGRASASNSDQTGTLSRASYHSSDPDQYPDLLDLPSSRYKQPSPTSTSSTLCDQSRLHHAHHGGHHHHQQPLHPAHLVPPAHLYHHIHASAFQRPNGYTSSGTLPHPHHPRSVSCDHTAGGPYVPTAQQPQQQQRPGYVTLPRRPRASWAGQQPSRDSPSPAFSLQGNRDPIYDGVGPRTSADGSSSVNLNKSVDGSSLPRQKVHPSLIPYCAPIKEEAPPTPQLPSSVHFNGLPTPADQEDKPKLDNAASLASVATLGGLEENLSAYFEPFGAALAPASPGARDSIASNDSDTVQLLPKESAEEETPPPTLAPIPESDGAPILKKLPPPTLPKKSVPPPTLPKPVKKPSKAAPLPPPKPKKPEALVPEDSFQDETMDGSEV